jgi:predicted dehydrogenase
VDIRIFGSKGMVLIDVERPRVEIHLNDGRIIQEDPEWKPGSYECILPLQTFVGLIQGQSVENKSPVSIGKKVVETLDAGLQSAKTATTEKIVVNH